MLRKSQLGRQSSERFICWRCSSTFPPSRLASNFSSHHGSRIVSIRSRLQLSKKPISSVYSRYTTAANYPISHSEEYLPRGDHLPINYEIRERLRRWEIENASSFVPPIDLRDIAAPGEINNDLTRPLVEEKWPDDEQVFRRQELDTHIFEHSDLVDIGIGRKFLRPGDLVELMSSAGLHQELAIFIRDFDTQAQFYTMSGKWLHRSSHGCQFFVPHFVDPQELQELLPYLPNTEVPEDMQNAFHTLPQSVPRNLGKSLVREMLHFWNQSDAIYQAAASKLDKAHSIVADPRRFKYATLEEIADEVLKHSNVKTENGTFSKPTLYAVHRSLGRDDIGFRSQSKGTLRAGGQYEIHPLAGILNVRLVTQFVRNYQEAEVAKVTGQGRNASLTNLHRFTLKARKLIDLSRKTRQFTTHGTIGPSSVKSPNAKTLRECLEVSFESDELQIIRFIESWVALDAFARHSSLNGIGSSILRAIGKYDDMLLGPSTGWTCLQELGTISPWENRATFDLRLISTRSNSQAAPFSDNGYIKDSMKDLRKDWGDLTVYCIDDPGAHEIDDGISIEPTNAPDEFWIHVHTADPASHIDPQSPIAQNAQKSIETVYMPEQVFPMLSPNYVQSNLSLAPNRPCLTFSAKMNTNGDILKYNVTVGIIHKVKFLSYATLKEVVLGSTAITHRHIKQAVGPEIPSQSPSRIMLESFQLGNNGKRDLQLLHQIGQARAEQLKAKGGLSGGSSGSSLSVSLAETNPIGEKQFNNSIRYAGDPTIEICTEVVDLSSGNLPQQQSSLVGTFMLVAGEVAARWCNERGIPVPFRITPGNPDKMKPSDYFLQEVLPSMDSGGVPQSSKFFAYLRLLGVQPSTTPGPHGAIGVDMMARCTSPLRRFGDLLLHWQVEAALLEQSGTGQSLVGNTKEDFLPFTKAQIDALLPHLDTKERMIRYSNRNAERHWLCQFLVRAWLFKQTAIPTRFPFFVRGKNPFNNELYGTLTTFLANAECTGTSLEGLNLNDVKEGDKLEVELEDVNVYSRTIKVRAVGRLSV